MNEHDYEVDLGIQDGEEVYRAIIKRETIMLCGTSAGGETYTVLIPTRHLTIVFEDGEVH